MCQAIDEMMADSREDGMKEGMEKGRIEALSDLLKKGTISIQDAADCMAMSVTEFKKLVNIFYGSELLQIFSEPQFPAPVQACKDFLLSRPC